MIYLASPYSHHDPEIVQQRFDLVTQYTAKCLKAGYIIYSPIVHCHHLAQVTNLPTSFEFWSRYNLGVLSQCRALWILELEGWQISIGVSVERKFAEQSGIPIFGVPWSE